MLSFFTTKLAPKELSLLKVAIFSRAFTLVIAFLSDLIYPQTEFGDHLVFAKKGENGETQYSLIAFFLKCLVRWDADYHFSIAQHGYLRHRDHCFFSLFPLLMRGTSYLFRPFIEEADAILLAGALINFIAFPVTAHYLYKYNISLLSY